MESTQLERILVNGGAIRKLTVGDPITGMKYTVGQEMGPTRARTGVISRIQYDQNSFYTAGVAKYLIYIIKNDDAKEQERIWKFFENQPVAVELMIDSED